MAFDYFKNWAEWWFFVLLIIGFIIALFAPSAVVSYMVIFVCGLIAGRMVYERKNKGIFPYLMIIVGFLIGYLLGAFRGEREIMSVLFVLGALISYYIYDKGLLRDLRF